MLRQTTHEVQLVSASLDQIRDFLGVAGDVPSTYTIADGLALSDVRVSKSSGFNSTLYVLNALVTVATSVSSGVLTVWINDRLKAGHRLVATLDGNEIRGQSE